MKQEHIAILGGALDPITLGHVELVKFVLKKCRGVDKIWLVPCYEHNFNKELSYFWDRFHMCLFAVEHLPNVTVSSLELSFKIKTTYDLISKLQEKYPERRFYDTQNR